MEFLKIPVVRYESKAGILQATDLVFKSLFLIMIEIVLSFLLMQTFIKIAWRLQAVMSKTKAALLVY